MEKNIFDLHNDIFSNNNNILFEIINDLNQLKNYTHDNIIIQRLSDIISKMNYIINENKKNLELIRNDISVLNQKFDKLSINNNINNQEIKYDYGRYVGQVINGLREGKGIMYHNNGDRYEGDFRNDKAEGKGIYYYSKSGDRYEGDWKNDKKEGKGIYYWKDGDRYEGDWNNDDIDGKGIHYYSNGDRSMGDYFDGEPIGKHVYLTINGEVKTENY